MTVWVSAEDVQAHDRVECARRKGVTSVARVRAGEPDEILARSCYSQVKFPAGEAPRHSHAREQISLGDS